MVRVVWLGGGLLMVSVACSALSLGNVQGDALIGRPLDISVPFVLGPGESVSEACSHAKVFFADEAVSSANVKTALRGGRTSPATSIRVQTTLPISEPFVRLDLQLGCDQFVSRSYVLLADLPKKPPVDVESTAPKNLAIASPQTPKPTASVANANPQVAEKSVRKAADVPVKLYPRVSPPSRSEPVAKPQSPRLTLDPVELVASVNRLQPELRLSVAVPYSDVESDEVLEKRKAARLLWRALNDSPELMAAQALSAEISRSELEKTKVQLAEAQQALSVTQAKLVEEEANRYSNPVVLGGLFALVTALGGVLVLWQRGKKRSITEPVAVWRKKEIPAKTSEKSLFSWGEKWKFFIHLRKKGKTSSPKKPNLAAKSFHGTYVDTLMPEDEWEKSIHPSKFARERRGSGAKTDFSRSTLLDVARSVVAEELFDLQQQVEFFISLGQADQAIEILKSHLSDHDVVSPLIYLDLLKIYHDLGRRENYADLQKQFNGAFHQNYPGFDDPHPTQFGLDHYESALGQIQVLWPKSDVLQTIEECILRDAFDSIFPVMTLEAYRELLLLYAIARDIAESDITLPSDASNISLSRLAPDSVFGQAHTIPMSMTMASAVSGSVLFPASTTDKNPEPSSSVLSASLPVLPVVATASQNTDLDLDLSCDNIIPELPVVFPIDANVNSGIASVGNAGSLENIDSESAQKSGEMLDLDFSDLSEVGAFAIKKTDRLG